MTHGSLFSGIGGFDLAAEWMGWENVFHCEWNPFGQKVLKYYWPDAESFKDITKTDFTKYHGTIDIISGGFPCQPYSTAGKRKGKEDERHLWPEMLRAVREVSPRWVVGENVRGLTNWNGGVVFDEVQADMEAEGYEVTPFLLPACGVGAPHRRDRIWFIAYSPNARVEGLRRERENAVHGFAIASDTNCHVHTGGLDARANREEATGGKSENEQQAGRHENWQRLRAESGTGSEAAANTTGKHRVQRHDTLLQRGRTEETEQTRMGCSGNAADAGRQGLSQWLQSGKQQNRGTYESSQGSESARIHTTPCWTEFPTQSPLCNGNDGFPAGLDTKTFFERIGIAKPKRKTAANFWREESVKAGGNAIVPQIAFQIFQAIQQYEKLNNPNT